MKSEIIITVGVGVKFRQNICAKKIILGIILNVVAKMLDIQKVLLMIQQLYVMKLQKQQKQLQSKECQQILNKKMIKICKMNL